MMKILTVNVRNIQSCRDFLKSLFEPNHDINLRSKISDAPESKFCNLFDTFEINERAKEDYLKWEKARWALDYRLVNKIICSLKD